MTFIRRLLAATVLMLLPLGSAAMAGDQQAEAFVRGMVARAIATHDTFAAPEDRNSELYRMVEDGFDLNSIGGYVLGGHWPKADASTKTEFLRAFAGYLVVTYAGRLAADPAARIEVIGSEPMDEDAMLVSSRLYAGDGSMRLVDWRLRVATGGWRIIDVAIDGVSMARTYRDQFASVMRSSGGQIAMLSERLRQKSQALQ